MQVPGPGHYVPETLHSLGNTGLSKSLGGRTKTPLDPLSSAAEHASPGPAQYSAHEAMTIGKNAPKAVLVPRRPAELRKDEVPGPGLYSPPSPIGQAPAPSLKGRNIVDQLEKEQALKPGPGAFVAACFGV